MWVFAGLSDIGRTNYITLYNLLIVLIGTQRSLQERLDAGETILCAEGYVMGLARRGYVSTGVWTGQFMLDYPDVLTSMHYEFVHCGSDVVQALQVMYLITISMI